MLEVLEKLGFRRLQTNAAAYNVRLVSAERMGGDAGRQVWICMWSSAFPPVLRFRFERGVLGMDETPRRAVVEPTLADADVEGGGFYPGSHHLGGWGEGVSRLPFVRVFSLDTKAYVYADVDDVHAVRVRRATRWTSSTCRRRCSAC